VRIHGMTTQGAWLKGRIGARPNGLIVPFLLSLAAGLSASASIAAGSFPVTINWKMADRFGPGYDRNHDGRPDLPNSYDYVNPGAYEVHLAADMGAAAGIGNVACAWSIASDDGALQVRATGPRPIVRLPQGRYTATVTVERGDGRRESARAAIRVKDVLIVAMGDSMACGEGNPEVPACWERGCMGLPRCAGLGGALLGRREPSTPALWADGGPEGDQPRITPAGVLPPANVLHNRAHRSTRSAPAQFAMQVEAADPHTSVTFVGLAVTGARTADMFVPDWSGENPALGPGLVLPAQFDELNAILGSRPVDVLALSMGFNDCRPFEILGELIRREVRSVDPLSLLAAHPTRSDWAAAAPGIHWGRMRLRQDAGLIYDFDEAAAAALAAARDELARLGWSIAQDPRLSRAEVYLLEYPDPTHVAGGETGEAIFDDMVPGLRINRRELDLARERLMQPLNQSRREGACRLGWTYVGGIFAAFQDHGYAARDTWFVRAKESEQIQGPRCSLVGYLRGAFSPGMLHPNHRGHQVIADLVYTSYVSQKRGKGSQTVSDAMRELKGSGS
jgi:hypothetical protein